MSGENATMFDPRGKHKDKLPYGVWSFGKAGALKYGTPGLRFVSLVGNKSVTLLPGDYIIADILGYFHPVKPRMNTDPKPH